MMPPARNASITAAAPAPTSGGRGSSDSATASMSLLSPLRAAAQCHQRAGPSRQVRLDPHLVVPQLPGPLPSRARLVGRQLDDHGTGPAEPTAGLLEHGLHVGQPGRTLPTGSGQQGPARVRPAPRGPARPTPPAPRRAGSTPPGPRGRASPGAAGRASCPGRASPPAGHRCRPRRPGRPPGWPSPPRARPALTSVAQTCPTTPGPSSLASASATAPLPVPASTTVSFPGPSARRRRASPRATSTTRSVSGRGIRTRESTHRSRPRKGQWPKTYCSGSPAARRDAMARAAAAAPAGTVVALGPPGTAPRASSTMKRAS